MLNEDYLSDTVQIFTCHWDNVNNIVLLMQ
jgi:hypothetical protein